MLVLMNLTSAQQQPASAQKQALIQSCETLASILTTVHDMRSARWCVFIALALCDTINCYTHNQIQLIHLVFPSVACDW